VNVVEDVPAIAALLTFLRSIKLMPYMAPRAGMRRQSTRCRSFAASFKSTESEEVDGDARPFSRCSMWSVDSFLVVMCGMMDG